MPRPPIIEPQRVDAPLTASATFLVVTINRDSPSAAKTVRSTLASVGDLSKNVAIRDATGGGFACTVGVGSDVWDDVMVVSGGRRVARPAELHPFAAVHGARHTAAATPGDLLFHIRADRRDLCFEFERQLLDALGGAVAVADTTVGFRYFDARDLLGFVDGTANPVAGDVTAATLVEGGSGGDVTVDAAAASAGGSYVVVQKYVHDMAAWKRLSTEQQEAVIGRTKWDNVELADASAGAQAAHKTLTTIEDDDTGAEYEVLRDNMPFGDPAAGVFGTYFIAYSARLWVVEKMMRRMFVGEPPGLHDRLLDYSTALTGCTFFAPSASLLAALDGDSD